jgi:hypothetical protein
MAILRSFGALNWVAALGGSIQENTAPLELVGLFHFFYKDGDSPDLGARSRDLWEVWRTANSIAAEG